MPLIARCAWHRTYHGFRLWLGVRSWRGWGITFTDTLCRKCLKLARAEMGSA